MKTGKQLSILIPSALSLAVLILDCETAIEGAKAGLEVCLHTVLPSLFPFIFLSSILSTALLSSNFQGNSALSKLYRIPQGAEGILLTGILGGYPVGARCIGEVVAEGRLSRPDAERMLVFCNAAGPAFIFGIISNLFFQPWAPWCLWVIHLFSGLFIANLIPSKSQHRMHQTASTSLSITQRLRNSVQVMGDICGWIILVRTLIAFSQKYFLRYLPDPIPYLISGILELANGCVTLQEVSNTGMRFVLCSVLLGFGGLCVALQTGSMASSVNQRKYLPGKCAQAGISFIIAYIVQHFVFEKEQQVHIPWYLLSIGTILFSVIVYLWRKTGKSSGILETLVV